MDEKTTEKLEQALVEWRNKTLKHAGLLEVARMNWDYARSEHLKAYEALLERYQAELQRRRVSGL